MIGQIYKNKFNPEQIALKFKDRSITYQELDTKIEKYATYFSKMGLKKGDKAILICHNTPEFIYTYLGISKLGATIVPVNLLLTVEEIKYVVKNSGAKTLIVHPVILSKLSEGKSFAKKTIFSLVQTTFMQNLLKLFAGINLVVLDEKLNKKLNKITEYSYTEIDDNSLISTFLYTSGTTGKPKAAMLTHNNLIANAQQIADTLEFYEKDNFLCVLPMFHSFCFTVCVLTPLYHGSTITILESFKPKEVAQTLAQEEITIFAGVPSMYIVLLNNLESNVSLPKLRLAISGGASLPIEIFNKVRNDLKLPIVEGYGLSEASPVVSFNPVDNPKPGSIGKPISGNMCKIVDENGNELEDEEVGELVVKGNNVMMGYYNLEQETQNAIKDGWLYTGDIAKRDSDGYYYIVDRKKDLVIVGGLNVYPREVEEVIYKHPKVKETAVVGIADKLRGEYVKAFVVLKDGEECSSKDLLRFLKQHLAKYKLPRKIEFIDELPKNATGKILKRQLKENN